jgi:hypothetical protein
VPGTVRKVEMRYAHLPRSGSFNSHVTTGLANEFAPGWRTAAKSAYADSGHGGKLKDPESRLFVTPCVWFCHYTEGWCRYLGDAAFWQQRAYAIRPYDGRNRKMLGVRRY